MHHTDQVRDLPRALLTGAQALTAIMVRHGLRLAFAYPGTSELNLCGAIDAHAGIEMIHSWGDREAAFMAAGANLLRRGTAASILHGARGLTNALGAITDSRRSETGALHLVGMASRTTQRFLPPHAEPDLLRVVPGFATHTFDCSGLRAWDAEGFINSVHQAIHATAVLPAGPVLLGLPQDLLEHPFIGADSVPHCSDLPDPTPPSQHDLLQAAGAIAAARNIVVIADDYLLRDPMAHSALGHFAEVLPAPVFQVAYLRGPMLFEHIDIRTVPTFAGFYDPHDPTHRRAMATADLIITVEDRNMYPRVIGSLPGCRKIAITSHPAMTRKNAYLSDTDIVLDSAPAATLAALTGLHTTRKSITTGASPRPAKTEPGCASAGLLADTIGAALHEMVPDAVVDDSQCFGGLLTQRIPAAGLRIFGSHGGFVGSGLPTAAGAAAAGGRIVCLLGDHGFINSVQALTAMAARRLPVTIIVCNNDGSVSLRKEAGAKQIAVNLDNRSVDFVAVAAAYGIPGETVSWPACDEPGPRLGQAAQDLQRWLKFTGAAGNPRLLELKTPSSDRDFWDGVWRVNGVDLE